MQDFKGLLALYSRKFQAESLLIDEAISIINEITNLKLNNKSLIIKEGVACLKIKPKEKLEIILNKNKILIKFTEAKIKITDLK